MAQGPEPQTEIDGKLMAQTPLVAGHCGLMMEMWADGEHLSIRTEGWHMHRGQILDWPSDKTTDAKQLHLRFGTFDPVAAAPQHPQGIDGA